MVLNPPSGDGKFFVEYPPLEIHQKLHLDMYIDDMNFICGLTQAKFGLKSHGAHSMSSPPTPIRERVKFDVSVCLRVSPYAISPSIVCFLSISGLGTEN